MKEYYKESNNQCYWIWETDPVTHKSRIVAASDNVSKYDKEYTNLNMKYYQKNMGPTHTLVHITKEEAFLESI